MINYNNFIKNKNYQLYKNMKYKVYYVLQVVGN